MNRGNCRISLCNNEEKEFCDTNTAWGHRAQVILDQCRKQKAGGWDGPPMDQPWTEVALRPSDQEFAALAAESGNSTIDDSQISVEENDAQVKIIEAQTASKKLNARAPKFTVTLSSYNVEMPGSQKTMTGCLPNTGSRYKVEKSKSTTLSVSSSVSVDGSLFKAMTIGIGVEITSSVTVTSTSGVDIVANCPNAEAVVILWAPLYDYYEGKFDGSDKVEHLWVPKNSEESKGNFKVRCLG